MPTSAYARFSSDEQKPTSIEDQLRNCDAIAAKEGLTIEAKLKFSDEAITGKAEGTAKRTGYRRLLDAIDAGECTVLIADELSRLTRAYSEGARLMELVEQVGLRVITGDGIDTNRTGWKVMWMFKLMAAAQEVENTSVRTIRGMVGALHRGYQIAQTPYGYRGQREKIPGTKLGGTRWVIHESEADTIRRIFRMKREGRSLVGIATVLTADGIMPPRFSICKGIPTWLGGTVYRLLGNPIYRGTFVWNNSSGLKNRARKRRLTLMPLEFEREALRLVSDEDWHACNEKAASPDDKPPRAPRGGGKHLFAGLVRCGDCQALLSVGGGPKSFSLYCPQCETNVRIGGRAAWIGHSSVAAARHALEFGLAQLFTGEVLEEFHERLKERLLQGPAREERDLREKAQRLEARVHRLKRLVASPELGAELFERELIQENDELRVVHNRLTALKGLIARMTPEILEAQLTIDPLAMLEALLRSDLEVYKVRATLRRLLARFELVGRPRKGCSVFHVEFIPGACVAELSSTPVMDSSSIAFEVTVSTTARRPVAWAVSARRI